MTPGQVIEQLAAAAYRNNIDPIRFTAAVVEIQVEEIFDLQCRDPRAVLLSRKIIACLLEVGWTMPGGTETP